ncbi:MAG: hypothetical protein HC837_13000 [Chloroflexaceae bacterium]|nr:hypothetical protein [Chloroflexaceae bacterium]
MAEQTIIDTLYEEHRLLIAYLSDHGEISLQISADNYFRKTLLLSMASYFEERIKAAIVDFAEEQARQPGPLIDFLRNKAIERQYHTFFSWRDTNANSFFGLFGRDFKNFMRAQVKADPALDDSIKAFLEVGNSRNELVHQNFATFPLNKTADEIYGLYRQAMLL